MLTIPQGEDTTGRRGRIGEMPQLLDKDQVVASPTGPHSLVLRLVGDLKARYNEPIRHEVLRWVADDAPRGNDPDGALGALDAALGTAARYSALLIILGDLVDMGLLRQDLTGLYVPDLGDQVLTDLNDRTPSFKSVIELD